MNVRVEDASDEFHSRRTQGIGVGNRDLELEESASVWGLAWAFDEGMPMMKIITIIEN